MGITGAKFYCSIWDKSQSLITYPSSSVLYERLKTNTGTHYFLLALRPNAGHGLLIHEVSR